MRRSNRFIGNANGATGNQVFSLLWIRREMQIGKQHLAFAQHCAFDSLWLLDLDHQFGARENLRRRIDDLRTNLRILGVADTDACPGPGFNQDFVAVFYRLAHTRRGHTNTILVVLDFLWNTYQHNCILHKW